MMKGTEINMSENKSMMKEMEELFTFILQQIEGTKLPKGKKSQIREEILGLQSFIVGSRPARMAIVGRRGAGKSSLINAIFGELKADIGDYKSQTGEGKWYVFENASGALDILDTRGLGESHIPQEESVAKTAVDEVKQSINEKCPDVLLFLCKGKEVGARLDDDIAQLVQLKEEVYAAHSYNVPIVGIVTQVDEMAPMSNSEPPFDHPKKQENISAAVDILQKKLTNYIATPINVIPTSAYLEYESGEVVYDRRFNIDVLLEYLMTELPKEAQVILAKLSKIKSVQKKLARTIGKSVMTTNGLIGATPVPVGDMPIITGLQLSMISTIAIISGKKLNRKTLVQFVGAMGVNVGVGVALRTVSRQLVKFLPGAGSVISGAIASAGTYALCEAAIAYFIDRQSEEEAKQVYKQSFKQEEQRLQEEEKKENEYLK